MAGGVVTLEARPCAATSTLLRRVIAAMDGRLATLAFRAQRPPRCDGPGRLRLASPERAVTCRTCSACCGCCSSTRRRSGILQKAATPVVLALFAARGVHRRAWTGSWPGASAGPRKLGGMLDPLADKLLHGHACFICIERRTALVPWVADRRSCCCATWSSCSGAIAYQRAVSAHCQRPADGVEQAQHALPDPVSASPWCRSARLWLAAEPWAIAGARCARARDYDLRQRPRLRTDLRRAARPVAARSRGRSGAEPR